MELSYSFSFNVNFDIIHKSYKPLASSWSSSMTSLHGSSFLLPHVRCMSATVLPPDFVWQAHNWELTLACTVDIHEPQKLINCGSKVESAQFSWWNSLNTWGPYCHMTVTGVMNHIFSVIWTKQIRWKTRSMCIGCTVAAAFCSHLQLVRYLRGCCLGSGHSRATTATEARQKSALPCYCIYTLSPCLSHGTCMLLCELVSAGMACDLEWLKILVLIY